MQCTYELLTQLSNTEMKCDRTNERCSILKHLARETPSVEAMSNNQTKRRRTKKIRTESAKFQSLINR